MSETVEERKVVERDYKVFGEYDFFDLEKVKKEITESIEQIVAPEFQKDVKITVKKVHYHGDSEPSFGLFIIYKDYENEDEKKVREGYEAKMKNMQEERDKREFERLSKKFA